jgi:hypothetical protein
VAVDRRAAPGTRGAGTRRDRDGSREHHRALYPRVRNVKGAVAPAAPTPFPLASGDDDRARPQPSQVRAGRAASVRWSSCWARPQFRPDRWCPRAARRKRTSFSGRRWPAPGRPLPGTSRTGLAGFVAGDRCAQIGSKRCAGHSTSPAGIVGPLDCACAVVCPMDRRPLKAMAPNGWSVARLQFVARRCDVSRIGMRIAEVFIGSSDLDLREHREAAEKACIQLGAGRGLNALAWRGTIHDPRRAARSPPFMRRSASRVPARGRGQKSAHVRHGVCMKPSRQECCAGSRI